ncbi:uncharacterized protein [Amphiura filiformis]|uniref:uncharacterized protein n=1 Tax=Amphiura filiformis TaxID=82378 RepID=UPI003B221E03
MHRPTKIYYQVRNTCINVKIFWWKNHSLQKLVAIQCLHISLLKFILLYNHDLTLVMARIVNVLLVCNLLFFFVYNAESATDDAGQVAQQEERNFRSNAREQNAQELPQQEERGNRIQTLGGGRSRSPNRGPKSG